MRKIYLLVNESAVSVEYKKIIGKYCRILNFIKKTEHKKSLPGCLQTPEAEILILGYRINMQFYFSSSNFSGKKMRSVFSSTVLPKLLPMKKHSRERPMPSTIWCRSSTLILKTMARQ